MFQCVYSLLFLGVILVVNPALAGDKPWPPVDGVPMTQWAKDVSPDRPVLPEYPRPQLVRQEWQNLNGLWDYAITAKDAKTPTAYDGKILVPYPAQSVLSQVNKKINEKSLLWSHRMFEIPAAWSGQRILLHFGAVNWESHVWLNGQELGIHNGDYDGFTYDITDHMVAGQQDLVVAAWNPVGHSGEPHGKQSLTPAGIFYTATTGIWQTVWLEPVPQSHIDHLKIVPDIDHHQIMLTVFAGGGKTSDQSVEAIVSAAGKQVGRATGKPGEVLIISIPHAQLWWPESPFLYDLKVTLRKNGFLSHHHLDSVSSYFGMRKISTGPDEKGINRMLLNNQFVFENGFLDQGFWPDGIYTAPTDDALRFDIEMARKLGFNMVRKHIKVEPDRWYYWADKLGLLVWQDMPAAGEMAWSMHKEFLADREGQYEMELRRMIAGRSNHPCIVVWITFNEGWGLSLKDKKVPGEKDSPSDESRAREQRMAGVVRQEDPTRLIDAESGTGGGGSETLWDFGLGDMIDHHMYGNKTEPKPDAARAAVIGECGWGLAPAQCIAIRLPAAVKYGQSGLVLTQLTDVENETNGALSYDRILKKDIPLEKTGAEIIEALHGAGFMNYPGGPAKP